MPSAVTETAAVAAAVFPKGLSPAPPPYIIAEVPGRAQNAAEQPVSDKKPSEIQTELASSHGDASLKLLSASIAEINQPISAVVMNAEAALRLLGAQPTDTEVIRRMLACIVSDGMRTGDIVNRTRALIEHNAGPNEASVIHEPAAR